MRAAFAVQQRGEKVRETRLGIGGVLRQGGPFGAYGGQLQFLAQGLDALMLQVHVARSSNES